MRSWEHAYDMQNIAVVSVNIKPEIPEQFCQSYKIRQSWELILGGSSGHTVVFQGLKLVACDHNTPLKPEMEIHFVIESDAQITTKRFGDRLVLGVKVYDDQARNVQQKTLDKSRSELRKKVDSDRNEITVCIIAMGFICGLDASFADLSHLIQRLKQSLSPLANSIHHQRWKSYRDGSMYFRFNAPNISFWRFKCCSNIAEMKHDVIRDVDAKLKDACSNLKDVEREFSEAQKSYPQKQSVLCRVDLPPTGIRGLVGIAVDLFTIHIPDVTFITNFNAVQKALSSAFGSILNFALFEDEDTFQEYKSRKPQEVKLDISWP